VYAHVDLFANAQRTPAFLALNPRGRVPVLASSNTVLTETPAILIWLTQRHPAAGILPSLAATTGPRVISDMTWFASGIHPCLTRLMVPGRFVSGESCATSVRDVARSALAIELSLIDGRLRARQWWLDEWSALDAYLFWLWARCGEGPIDLRPYPNW